MAEISIPHNPFIDRITERSLLFGEYDDGADQLLQEHNELSHRLFGIGAVQDSPFGGTTGSVLFIGTQGISDEDNANFFWDDTNNRLGIGTSAPQAPLHISGANDTELFRISGTNQMLSVKEDTVNSTMYLTLGANNQTNGAIVAPETFNLFIDGANDSTTRSFNVIKDTSIANVGGTTLLSLSEVGSLTLPIGPVIVSKVVGGTDAGSSLSLQSTSGVGTTDHIKFLVGNNGATEAMRIATDGDVGIGASDPAAPLHVVRTSGGVAVTQLIIENDSALAGTASTFSVRNGQATTAGEFTWTRQGSDAENFAMKLYSGAALNTVWTVQGATGIFDIGNSGLSATRLQVLGLSSGVNKVITHFISQTTSGFFAVSDQNTVLPPLIGSTGNDFVVQLDSSGGAGGYPTTERLRLQASSGNLSLNGASFPSIGTAGLIFPDGTALATMGTNTAGLYADDVGGTVEMFGINEAGTTSQLTGLTIRKTSDESVTNSTVHQADDHLTVNLAASSAYYFEIHDHWTTAGATAGISVQLDGTAGLSSLKADVIIFDHTANTMSALARITAFNSATGAGLTGDNSFLIRGTIVTSTAGTLFLEWAQNTADALNATTVQANSAFVLRKLNA